MVETNIANSQPVSDEYLEKMNAYWRAAQLYLLDNPLLREPLTMEHVKKKIVGHWGTVPGPELRVCSFKSCNQEI